MDNFPYFYIKTYIVTPHKNRGYNICFYREIRKIILKLSSIPPLIWSSVFRQTDISGVQQIMDQKDQKPCVMTK